MGHRSSPRGIPAKSEGRYRGNFTSLRAGGGIFRGEGMEFSEFFGGAGCIFVDCNCLKFQLYMSLLILCLYLFIFK